MDIYDPIAIALGITPTIHITDYPSIEQLLEEHPASVKATSNFTGKKHTPETRTRISNAGRRPCSEAKKQSLREAMLRREQDPEWLARKTEMRAKMSVAASKRRLTDDHKAKIAASVRRAKSKSN